MNDYDVIAPFYDIEHALFDEDVEMYRNFAELCRGPLLELACGSGRLLVPLAEAGYEVVGVDTSARMLHMAEQYVKQADVNSRVQLVQQDMCTMHLGRKFRLAIIALGSFGHMTSRRVQQQALATVHAHLSPGGTFIIDISNADARYMESLSGQLLHQGTWTLDDGTLLTHFVSPASSPTKHLLELTHFYDRHLQGGPIERTLSKTHLYLFERNEMELLLERAGFVIKDVYGDYELNPYELESPRMIFRAEVQ